MVGERFYCRKFQANQFNKARCQNCFKSKDSHSDEALQSNKMTRNKTKFGYLYIAPENFDVTNASQKNRRWQRRWFVLYDDGELAYSLDQHPETVPQGIVDMTSCYDIRFADELTQNAYSLMVKMSDDRNLYFKADTSDEIRWWYEVLAVYPKRYMMQNGSSTPKMIKKEIAPPSDDEETALPSTANGTKTIIEVNLVVPNSRDRRQQQQRRVSDPWSQAKVDVSRVESLHHGTPRSVKNRKNSRQKDDSVVARSKTCIVGDHALVKDDTCPTSAATITQFKRNSSNDNNNNNSDSSDFGVKTASRNGGVDVRPSCSSSSKTTPSELLISTSALREIANNKADVDSSIHTLRKGWLMLKGRNETDWTKHWVVLSGFSLKLFKDAWAEDSGSSAVNVDLVHCEQVVPISVTRNYGIELRCKNCRYILSAMTPGIRDSWVSAIKQNVAGMTTSVAAVGSELIESSSDGLPTVQKQKRIAYVAPDSHSRCTTTDESCTEEDDDDNASLRSSSRADEGSMSESLFDSGRELASDEDAAGSGSSTPRRRRSLSPSVVRRSPVSRVKERNSSSRQHRSPASQRRDAINRSAELSSPASSISVTPSLIAAHVRLESVRNELQRTRDRLNATTEENEWLKTATNRVGSVDERPLSGQSQSVDDLDRLRRTLQEAERDILRKQDEIETLQRKLDFSVNELSGTENVLSASLVDLEKEREQFDRLSSKWNHRVVAMESQLRDTVKRLDRRERDTRDKSDQLKEMQTLQRRHEEMQRNVEILSRRLKEAEKMRYGGPGTEQRSTMMVHLEEKLAESEKKVAALSEKVHRLEESMDASDAAALTTTDKAKDESSLTAADTEAALETMRQMCREQSRRLLATLRNEAEFLQRLMSDKLSDLEASNLVVDADSNEIRDLLDDLNAVQQYLNEFDQMERDQQQSTSSKDAFHFKDVLNRLIELQEKLILLSRADNSRRTEELQHWKERAEVGSNSTNLKNEVAELEQELVEVQNAHSEEIESLRASLQVDIDDMRQQLTNEQERRKKLANDMQNMKRLNDQSLDTIERNHSQLLEEIRNDHGDEVRRLIDDYEQQLQEEKEATRHALDALQKAHEHEMARQVQKARNEMSHVNHSGSISTSASSLMLPLSGDNWSRNKSHDFQDMLERMNKEICELSSAYSTKCLEASLLEDELDEAKIVLERINKTTSSDIAEQLGAILTEMKRAKNLQLQLCNVESELNACKHRIAQLEANFDRTKNTFDDLNGKIIPSTSIVVADVSLEPARYEAEIVYEREEETSPVAAEYTPKGVRARKVNPTSRRNDSRYYSSPNLERTDEAILAAAVRRHSLTPDSVLQELRTAMGLPVAERRKFFESLGKQSSM